MSEFRKGDRVLVEAEIVTPPTETGCALVREHDNDARRVWASRLSLHPDPGVPVADLLEELRLRDWCGENLDHVGGHGWDKANARANELQAARLAATKTERKVIGETEHGDLVYAIDDR